MQSVTILKTVRWCLAFVCLLFIVANIASQLANGQSLKILFPVICFCIGTIAICPDFIASYAMDEDSHESEGGADTDYGSVSSGESFDTTDT